MGDDHGGRPPFEAQAPRDRTPERVPLRCACGGGRGQADGVVGAGRDERGTAEELLAKLRLRGTR
ncbi:hypothetical protein AB0953_28490 [Streptomyces sp. NPDC046866]|uniref:hypothetical protein n=1 Tax=Streptomyces sp. NPDC046866 TaxID=3154921 RepID=UPI003454BB98